MSLAWGNQLAGSGATLRGGPAPLPFKLLNIDDEAHAGDNALAILLG